MVLTILSLLLIAYVPGAVLFRLPIADRDRRAALPADERTFWAVVLSVAWSLAVTLALGAVSAYSLRALLSINVLLSLAAVLAARSRLRLGAAAPRLSPSAALPVLLIAFGLWQFVPPAEFVTGGLDPGTYMNEGIQIAQRGALVVRDPVVAEVPAETRDLFIPSHGRRTYYGLRFMGFFVRDPQAGTVVGQFPHLFPASIAIGYGLNGLSGARQTIVVWTLLGTLAVYFLGVRLIGRGPAVAAAALLLLNVVTVWFGRYPNAEMVMQALLFAAILACTHAARQDDRFFAATAGALLALLPFLRFDAVLAIGAVTGAVVLGWVDGRRVGVWFVAPLVAGGAVASAYYTGPMRAYAELPIAYAQDNAGIVTLMCGAVVVALAAAWALARVERVARPLVTWLPSLLAVVAVGLAVYAYFFREASGRLAWHDAMAFRAFGWYAGELGLALAVAGAAIVTRQRFWQSPSFFLTTFTYALFFFYKIRIVPDHFWMTRRFLPVVLPAAFLLVAGFAAWLAAPERLARLLRTTSDARTARVASLVLVLAVLSPLAVRYWYQAAPVRAHVEYAGLIPRLEQLAQRFGDDDLVLVESRNASDLHVLGLPLAYIYGKSVLVLNTPRPEKPAMEAFIAHARAKHREVFFLGSGGTDLLTKRIGVEPVGSDRFQVPEYDSPLNAYPAGVRRKEFDYGVYRFVDVSGLVKEPVLVIGERDDLQVVRFHAKEKDPRSGRTYRWTRDVSYVSLLSVTPATRQVVLWMADGRRPPRAGAARVEVSIGEHVLGAVDVGAESREYAFEVPRDLAASVAASDEPARLRLRVNTWSPRRELGAPDDRELGVMLSRVEVR